MRFAVLAFLVVTAAACVSVRTETREVLRVAPLRGETVAAPALDPAPALIAAGADLLTDDELKDAQSAIAARLAAQLREAAPGRALKGARLVVDRCKLTGLAGRRATVHQARCRVSLRAGDAQLASHEATVVREGPAKAVTEARAAEIQRLTRNPLLVYDESEAALVEAALTAAGAVLVHAPDADSPAPALRRSALRRLARAERADQVAAAAIDLARYGETDDAIGLIPHLAHHSALVRRAVATALAELLHRDAWQPVHDQLANEKEDAVRVPLEQAVARLRALYPDLPIPSKSSTDGGRESGVTP